jgi:hypothetical protein
LRRTHPEVLIKVKAEIEKKLNADFLEVSNTHNECPRRKVKSEFVWTLSTKTGLALKTIFHYHT